jgi:hypothetical protein
MSPLVIFHSPALFAAYLWLAFYGALVWWLTAAGLGALFWLGRKMLG